MKLNNLVVLDWDDTLFPTNKIMNSKHQISIAELTHLSKLIYDALMAYIDRYKAHNIVIVSASEEGWIQQSLSRVCGIGHFSCIYNLLFIQNQIKMIHPSNIHLPFINSKQVFSWKRQVFCSLIKERASNSFISIGDSIHEFKASKSAVDTFGNMYIHRIKLIQRPSFKTMMLEMKFLLELCTRGVFELSAKDKANVTVDYESERNKRI